MTLQVFGIASSIRCDQQHEMITRAALREAFGKLGLDGHDLPILVRHSGLPVGVLVGARVQDDGMVAVTAIINNPAAERDILRGYLRGFSIGGDAWQEHRLGLLRVIDKITLRELSLTPRGSNPDATVIRVLSL